MTPFAPWMPDVADLDASVTKTARNVLPGPNCYRPFPSLATFNNAVLPAQALGLAATRQNAGAWQVWAGTAAKLYQFSGGTWADRSRLVGGNYAVLANEIWQFRQYGPLLIAVNGVDVPQAIDINSGTNFAALGGSPPVARNVSTIGDFAVLSSMPANPQRVQWSGLNNATIWTPGTSSSDYQDFPDGGRVTGVAGGQMGYVLQEYAVNRMTFNPASIFDFVKVVDGKGCLSPYGYATVGSNVYFVSEDGFYRYSSNGLEAIGASRVNAWFLNQCDTTRFTSVQAISDPYRSRILWAFYSTALATAYDRLIVYDWQLDKWAYGEVSGQIWGSAATPATNLDSITTSIDALPYSLDSRLYEGGRPTMAAINTSRQLAFLEGPPLAATIETQEVEAVPGKRAFVTGVRPVVDTTTATISISARERRSDAAVYGAPAPMEDNGMCSVFASGRYMRAKLDIPAGATWTEAIGLDFEAQPDGDI